MCVGWVGGMPILQALPVPEPSTRHSVKQQQAVQEDPFGLLVEEEQPQPVLVSSSSPDEAVSSWGT